MNFKYHGDELVCNNTLGDFDVDKTKVSYIQNGAKIFGIQFKYNHEHPMELKLKCQSILDMLNGKIVIQAGDSQFATLASLDVEVESL